MFFTILMLSISPHGCCSTSTWVRPSSFSPHVSSASSCYISSSPHGCCSPSPSWVGVFAHSTCGSSCGRSLPPGDDHYSLLLIQLKGRVKKLWKSGQASWWWFIVSIVNSDEPVLWLMVIKPVLLHCSRLLSAICLNLPDFFCSNSPGFLLSARPHTSSAALASPAPAITIEITIMNMFIFVLVLMLLIMMPNLVIKKHTNLKTVFVDHKCRLFIIIIINWN